MYFDSLEMLEFIEKLENKFDFKFEYKFINKKFFIYKKPIKIN